jgi:hypothetical protein
MARGRGESESTTQSQRTDPGVVLGTVGYMSPEQVRGEPADHRSDLFSLGAVLYEMLSGQRAFHGTSSVETLSAILKEEPAEIAPEAKIPPVLDRLVRHCLEKNPEDRFQSARDLAFGLGGVTAASAIGARASALGRRPRGRLWLAGGLLALAVGTALSVGVSLGRRSSTTAPPTYKQITFRRGFPSSGRFTSDGKTVVYAANWDDAPAPEIYSVRTDAPESRPLGLPPGQVAGVSSKGELAVILPKGNVAQITHYPVEDGTLALVPLSGGTPRRIADGVICADWAPDGERLAALRLVDGARQIEFPLGTVVARETEADAPFTCPRVSPRGNRLAFGTPGGYRVVEIEDGRTISIETVPDWGHGFWWSWSPDGREIWFTTGQTSGMRSLETVTLAGRRRLLTRIPGTMSLKDVARDGLALFEHGLTRVRVFSRRAGEDRERELSVFDGTRLRDLSSDGRVALLFERGAASSLRQYAYVRGTDGSPPTRLAEEGDPRALSPDGRHVLLGPATLADETPRWSGVRVVPTEAGEVRDVPLPGLENPDGLCFVDDARIIVRAGEKGPRRGRLTFLASIQGGARRPVTPVGVRPPCACDSQRIACLGPGGRLTIYPLDGSAPREVPGSGPPPFPIRLSPDGRSLFAVDRGTTRTSPIRIERVDLATGQRTLVHEVRPLDATGFWGPSTEALCKVTPDGRGYACHYWQFIQDLYVAEGLA